MWRASFAVLICRWSWRNPKQNKKLKLRYTIPSLSWHVWTRFKTENSHIKIIPLPSNPENFLGWSLVHMNVGIFSLCCLALRPHANQFFRTRPLGKTPSRFSGESLYICAGNCVFLTCPFRLTSSFACDYIYTTLSSKATAYKRHTEPK